MRQDKLRLAIICFFVSCFVLAGSSTAYNLKSLRKTFVSLESLAPETGAVIFEMNSGKTIFSSHEHKTFVPASVAKLITSYTALKELGPDYTFKTEIYVDGPVVDGKLDGNLYIKGYGDPFLVDEKTWILAKSISSLGLKRLKGDLVVDGSFFSPLVTKIKIDKNESRPYNAVLSALSVDFNTVTFRIFRSNDSGKRGFVSVIPSSPYVELENSVKVSSKITYPQVAVTKRRKKGGVREVFKLSGRIPANGKPFEVRSNVSFPLLFSGWSIKKKLEAVGIKIDGSVVAGKVPEGAVLFTTYSSPSLREILYGLNRFSNNFMAEMVFRVLGARLYGPPATVQKGRRAIETELKKLGIKSSEYFIVNGSGLSREMLVSPFAIRKVLTAVYTDFSIRPEFLASMATPRTPGTLKCRFSCYGRTLPVFRAKTGSLNGVVTVAGYTCDSRGRVLGIVILCNKVGKPWKVKRLLDKVVCLLQQ